MAMLAIIIVFKQKSEQKSSRRLQKLAAIVWSYFCKLTPLKDLDAGLHGSLFKSILRSTVNFLALVLGQSKGFNVLGFMNKLGILLVG